MDISSDPSVLDPNFLTVADNIEYLEGGQRKKRLGTTIYSTSTGNTIPSPLVSAATRVRAVADFWKYGASLTPTQAIVAVAGQSIFGSTGDGSWTAASATSSFGLASNVQTQITLAGDYAVISDESGVPVAWNQTKGGGLTVPSTGAAWPSFSGSVYHLNRLFMYGQSTAPSQVNFSAAGNIFDSTGTDTGSFPVATGDGDRVMAISQPYFASLYVFKGPQHGSIWQLSGATPTTFSLVQMGFGAPVSSPRAVVTTPTDIFWLSNYGVHSLETTVKFGNVEQAFLSLPIQRLWRDGLITRSALNGATGFWHPTRNVVGWCVTPSGFGAARWILLYNYALSDPKPGGKKFWSIIKLPVGIAAASVVLTPATWDNLLGIQRGTGTPTVFFGNPGCVRAWDSPILSDSGIAYTATVTTPIVSRFRARSGESPETQEKVFRGVTTYFRPKGVYNADLAMTIDRRSQSTSISLQGGGATLT